MDGRNRLTETRPSGVAAPTRGSGQARLWITWVLALLTVPGAAIVMLFALGAVMSTDACSESRCPNLGAGIDFGVLFYGAPVVALLVVVVSVFTAKLRFGIAVPLVGVALLVADVAILAATVAQ
ncbi:hypothetical protein PJK45_26660 [Mycobacterium kansasii]|uniref:Transmembrane protein n=2 Tax=Mycobacterium kansasii TaxID=1768 RepID=A0A653EN77_MYCKA|nr:hypothetical protein [Mycobacterium kansasii]AGZ51125.1 hypothetical protein MKAN_13285 [Mycobacterium kansasii ATCC 12478]ARG57101.1 hypothetical protein B1T43_15795 [Mycobacterium kansasii]ARG62622.1 hypothetical protein B1T45_16330 [Mycobacterium kansasii]ARG70241.1 hypothetical protein B1T47_15555 [Mycobacterium kansasii]ARG75150.1 hypothetical protein B1T51_12545 [Mycobacterium kansasii]